jgi:tetratricopeptide (TPR) repeat protein
VRLRIFQHLSYEAEELFVSLCRPHARALCIKLRARVAFWSTSGDTASRLYKEARQAFAELQDEVEAAHCTIWLAGYNDSDIALQELTAAQEVFERANALLRSAECSKLLGVGYYAQGDYDAAEVRLTAAWHQLDRLGSSLEVANCRILLGQMFLDKGDFEAAEQHIEAARTNYARMRDRRGLAQCAAGLGALRRKQGRLEETRALWQEARSLCVELGLPDKVAECDSALSRLAVATDSDSD